VEKGHVRLSRQVAWGDGQQVVVIPLPRTLASQLRRSPPRELLDEDAAEFRRRPDTIAPLNRSELE
jgi:hypothetical protein